MLIERVGEKEFRLHHADDRVKAGTVLVFLPAKGRKPERLKGFKVGAYCTLTWWKEDKKSCTVRTAPPMCLVDATLEKAQLVHFYRADAYLRWLKRVFRAQRELLVDELQFFRRKACQGPEDPVRTST